LPTQEKKRVDGRGDTPCLSEIVRRLDATFGNGYAG
jgi:hypothetical protein